MYTEEPLKFYPKHPSDRKTHQIETSKMPMLEQDAPFEVKALCHEFHADADSFFAKYVDKRFAVAGIAKKVGPDIHHKPSIEISDCMDGQTYALVIFQTDDHYNRIKVGDRVVVRANYLVMSNHYGTVMKHSELVSVENMERVEKQQEPMRLKYPFFDGEKVIEDAAVAIVDGMITQITATEEVDKEHFLFPCLIDAHTHMGTKSQIEQMLRHGISATCDVAAYASLIQDAKPFEIISSAGMTMGTLSGKAYVQRAIEDGAAYIKVLLMEPNLMLKSVLKEICNTAHAYGKKVAAHAVSVKTVNLSVECGVDILIHVPMKEEFPESLAQSIAGKGIVVVPTLVMMEAFAKSDRRGYKPKHYKNAENAVRLLHKHGVTILAGTDANTGSFAPEVEYGTSMHRELELLVQAGMAPAEALSSATSKIAEVFAIRGLGTIKEGKRAALVLVEGRPDRQITDIKKIKQIWIDGKTIL